MFFVYFLRCSDNTLYCGKTTDLEKRLKEHIGGKRGAKYTRGRAPLELVYFEKCKSVTAALKREFQLKKLSKKEKESLVKSHPPSNLQLR